MTKLSRRNFLKGLAATGAFVIVPYTPKLLGEINTNKDGFIYYVNGHHWFELRAEVREWGQEHMIAWYGLCPNKAGIITEYGNAIYVPHSIKFISQPKYLSGMGEDIKQALWVDFTKCGKKYGFFKWNAPPTKREFCASMDRFYRGDKPEPNEHLKDDLTRGDIVCG